MAKLRIERRDAGYARGQEIHEVILRTAFELLVDSGFDALTFGNIAKRMNTKSGNISYYFPQKDTLVAELLNGIISNYEHEFDHIMNDASFDDEQKLKEIAQMIIMDLTTRETTRVFPELWARSNHDPFVQERLDELYRRGRQAIVQLVSRLRPDLPPEQCEMIGVIWAACFEGLTIFAGHGKAWEPRIDAIAHMTKTMLFDGVMHMPAIPAAATTPVVKRASVRPKTTTKNFDG
ncbi:TetR/AcrR family transcriptional regulator [Sphingobium sp. CECT 9361]|uniref:TetR/AcrR family transcriptional regulator n=1 Tax=Sphingobium sp. CECT 9361 TaxID=2845384 RepID=UPI001E4726F5|nr:TetR/AcrR family transcriptional regulator [Sphingobium sp. CECT 9361]CAH0357231.1 HTH-type transcriptional regulator BetI [Sphingobium sp. CECT 9361]